MQRLFFRSTDSPALPNYLVGLIEREKFIEFTKISDLKNNNDLALVLLSADSLSRKDIDTIIDSKNFNKFFILIKENNSKSQFELIYKTKNRNILLIDRNIKAKTFHLIINQQVATANSRVRREKLLFHIKSNKAIDKNNAIHFLISLIKGCALISNFTELDSVFKKLKKLLKAEEFQFLELSEKEQVNLPKNRAINLNDGDIKNIGLKRLLKKNWNHTLLISIQSKGSSGEKKLFCLVFYKNDLFPFSHEQLALLELAIAPLTFALEKVYLLQTEKKASLEWRNTFDAINEPITVINDQFELIKANKSFANLLDIDIEYIKNRKCHILLGKSNLPCKGCAAVSNSNLPYGNRVRTRKNTLLSQWSYNTRLKREPYYVQFYRNISNEATLSASLAQNEKMRSLGLLIKAISHQIFNPVTAVLSTAQMLTAYPEDFGLEESQIEEIYEIEEAAKRASLIIKELSNFVSEDNNELEQTDVMKVIQGALVFSKSLLANVNLEFRSAEENFIVLSNYSALQQIVFNLITNAVHAMDRNKNLFIRVYSDGFFVKIEIEDSGIGISKKNLKRIFEPFYTSKEEGKGTGLGLTIVRMLADKYNAKIEAESEVGKGTKFTISIPVVNHEKYLNHR